MSATATARVSHRGQTSLPAELRHRWGIGGGGEVGIIDLGDSALIVPGGVGVARAELRNALRGRYDDAVASLADVDLADQQVASTASRLILDDRLLIEYLLAGLDEEGNLHTTSYWYHRACRAAVAGAGGHLSGPFTNLDRPRQHAAIRSLLALPDEVGLPDPRSTVPLMAELSERHARLNLLNLEAVATALALDAVVLLSMKATRGVLPVVLEAEHLSWRTVDLD